ncbi:MAG: STAS/SEC14 domain-containing protein [Erythrobacter sp.]|uniref:STAS/SEC14 domain-containing protein n=1 Tax=Erythrobacter sp. TaxID=1042 RepID=UPI0032ECCBBB
MIAIEKIGPNAHRVAIYGEFHEDDARTFVEFAQDHHAAGEGGNVLIDLVSLASWSFSAMSEELVHIPALLRWIYSLDRIALVSDEQWMRSAARLESALLPGVSYAVYDEDEADAARRWVLGENDHPHGGAVRELDLGEDIAGFELVGRLDREEAERVLDTVRARLAGTDCSKLMVVIRKWHGFAADAALSRHAMSSKIDLLKHCDRYAVVGGPDWLRALAGSFGALVQPEVRTFELDEEDEALAWLRS